MTTNDTQLNSQLYTALAGRVGGDFQMFGTPAIFRFPVATQGTMDAGLYQLLSVVPEWKSIGNPGGTGLRLFDAYQQALPLISIRVSADKQRQLQDAKDQQTRAGNDYVDATTKMNQAYNVAKQNGGAIFAAKYPAITDWIASPGGQAYADAADRAAAALVKANQFVATITAAMYPDFQRAMDAMTRPADSATDAPPGWVRVADNGVLHWQPSFTLGKTADQVMTDLTSGAVGKFAVSLDAGDSRVDTSHVWAAGSAGYETPFWGVSGTASTDYRSLLAADSRLKVDVTAESMTTVPVTPGAWFDGGILKRAALGDAVSIDKPWTAFGPGRSLFGPNGLIATQVTGLVVAYKPAATLSMSDSTFSAVQKQVQAGSGLRIGPFSFGGSGGSASETTVRSDRAGSLTLETTSEDPVILGYAIGYPGGRKP